MTTQDSYREFETSSVERRRLLRAEELILEVTEALAEALARENLSKAGLAERLGKSRAFVTQVLAGNRNLTLRTAAEFADALGYRLRVRPVRCEVAWQQELRATLRRDMLRRPGWPPNVVQGCFVSQDDATRQVEVA